MKIKNYALCALAVLALSLTNCNDDDNSLALDDGHVPSCNEATNERCLYAKVENASEYSDIVEVRLMAGDIVLARGNWVGDGFTIELPETVNPNYLRALEIGGHDLSVDIPPTMTVSDNSVKTLSTYDVYAIDKDGNIVVVFWPYAAITSYECANMQLRHTYVDSDVVISGYTDGTGCYMWVGAGIMVSPNVPSRKTFSIEWKKGWNFWRTFYTPFTERDGNRLWIDSCEESFSTDFDCGEIKWREARVQL